MPPVRSKKRDDFYRDRRRRKVCAFCADKTVQIDYKEVNRLRRYLSERAKIEPRRKTGTCAAHQRVDRHCERIAAGGVIRARRLYRRVKRPGSTRLPMTTRPSESSSRT